jgi:hypothetical protein
VLQELEGTKGFKVEPEYPHGSFGLGYVAADVLGEEETTLAGFAVCRGCGESRIPSCKRICSIELEN